MVDLNSESYKKYKDRLLALKSAWGATYTEMARDFRYAAGGAGMWDDIVYQGRNQRARPTMSLPLLPAYIDRVVAPIRMHPPGMACRTLDKKVQKLANGLLRAIERSSNASNSYAISAKSACTAGLGWLYLAIEDVNGLPEIRIKTTIDPTAIMIDPLATAVDGCDAQYAVYRGLMDKEKARQDYGEKAANRGIDYGLDGVFFNVPENSVMDCVWYTLEPTGMRITRTIGEAEVFDQLFEGVRYLPVVPVIGEELLGAPDRRYGGMIRRGMDINSSINVTISNIMELVALAPKSPLMVATAAVKGHRNTYETINTEPHAYIQYNHVDENNNPIPAPFRLDNVAQTQGLQSVTETLHGFLGRTMGMTDAMLGELQSAGESGRALIARMEAGEGATAQYLDHLTSSITQLARVLIKMIPLVYAGERPLTIIDENGCSQRIFGDITQILTPEVVDMLDVEIESGPQMEMRRRAAGDSLGGMMANMGPDKMMAVMDLWVDTQEFENGDQIKDRLKKLLPPEMTQGEGDEQGEIDPQAMAALAEAEKALASKDQSIQYMEGIITQLQQAVQSQQALAEAEITKTQIQSQTSLQKTYIEQEGAKERELIKQGSEDTRLAAKLTAEQQKQVNAFIAELTKQSEAAKNDVRKMAIDHHNQEMAPKVPLKIADEIAKSESEEEKTENEIE